MTSLKDKIAQINSTKTETAKPKETAAGRSGAGGFKYSGTIEPEFKAVAAKLSKLSGTHVTAHHVANYMGDDGVDSPTQYNMLDKIVKNVLGSSIYREANATARIYPLLVTIATNKIKKDGITEDLYAEWLRANKDSSAAKGGEKPKGTAAKRRIATPNSRREAIAQRKAKERRSGKKPTAGKETVKAPKGIGKLKAFMKENDLDLKSLKALVKHMTPKKETASESAAKLSKKGSDPTLESILNEARQELTKMTNVGLDKILQAAPAR